MSETCAFAVKVLSLLLACEALAVHALPNICAPLSLSSVIGSSEVRAGAIALMTDICPHLGCPRERGPLRIGAASAGDVCISGKR